ncbi:4263_t:CDS:2, partial [Rhizophagus irregularis]
MTSAIQNIESPSHKISTEMNIEGNPKISKITLTEQITYLEKDFILVVKSKDLDQPRAFVEYNPETQTNCIMLTLVPKFSLNTTISELVFVVDRSGSMGVEPMKKAAQALELLLRSLPEDCYFNVVSFGSDYDSLFPKSELYSETTLSEALNLAQTMKSNYRGTKVYNVLEWVFKNSRDDMSTSIFLITDGEVRNVDQIVELVSKHEEEKNDDLRLFSLGIGDSVSHNLVESVARAGKGYAQFVTNDERMDKKVIGMLKNALKPPIKDYNITWTEVNLLDEKELDMTPIEVDKPTISFMIQQAPYIIPPIYSGVRFIVYCILEKNIEPWKVITLKATSQDGPMKLDIPLDPVTLQGSKIHRLAARKLIQDLNDKKSFIHKHPKNANKHIPDSLVKEHIVKLAKTFNLASKYTSLFESQIIPQIREVPQLIKSYGRRRMLTGEARQEDYLKSLCSFNGSMDGLEKLIEGLSVSQQEVNVIHKEPKIENLFKFLKLQSFDGKFLPNETFYEFFYKNYLDGFNNFKQEIEKELSELSEKEIEEILTSCIAIAYLKIVMFDDFKDELIKEKQE